MTLELHSLVLPDGTFPYLPIPFSFLFRLQDGGIFGILAVHPFVPSKTLHESRLFCFLCSESSYANRSVLRQDRSALMITLLFSMSPYCSLFNTAGSREASHKFYVQPDCYMKRSSMSFMLSACFQSFASARRIQRLQTKWGLSCFGHDILIFNILAGKFSFSWDFWNSFYSKRAASV